MVVVEDIWRRFQKHRRNKRTHYLQEHMTTGRHARANEREVQLQKRLQGYSLQPGRDDPIRTGDLAPPRRVLYRLSYIPNLLHLSILRVQR